MRNQAAALIEQGKFLHSALFAQDGQAGDGRPDALIR